MALVNLTSFDFQIPDSNGISVKKTNSLALRPMKFNKALISVFLLFAYSLGFSTVLVPRCEHSEDVKEHVSQHIQHHEHHQHDGKNGHGHEHVVHEGHFDDGLLELFICIISESEYPDFESKSYTISSEINNFSVNKLSLVKSVLAQFEVSSEAEQNNRSAGFNTELHVSCLSPIILNSPYRGPPSTSC